MAEVYEMMMKLGLEGTAMAGLANMSSVLTGMHHKVGQIEKGFSSWKTALVGVGSLIGGAMILGGLEKLIEKTKTFSDELVQLKKSGSEMQDFISEGAVTKAFDISKRVGMSVTDLLKIPGMTYSILGKEEAESTWESLAKYSYTQQLGDQGFKGEKQKHALLDAVRAGEATGRLTDESGKMVPEKLDHWLDLVSRIKTATHGVVNEQTLLGLAKQGGLALRNMTDEGIMSEAVMAQVLGGQRVGTATMSLMQQFAGGQMTKKTALGMEQMGLMKPDEWSVVKGSNSVNITEEASKRLNRLISRDPMELAAKLREEFMNKGINDPEERMRLVMRAFGRQTTQRFTAEEVNNFEQMMQERNRMMKGLGSEAGFKLTNAESVSANLNNVSKAWENFQIALAGENSEHVIAFLQRLTTVLNDMTGYVRSMDPDTLRAIGLGIAALGVGLIGGGAVAILAAIGPAGWLIGGLAALAVALTDERFTNWLKSTTISDAINKWVSAGWERIVHNLQQVGDVVSNLASLAWGGVVSGLTSIQSAISSFIDWLAEKGNSIKKFFDLSRFLSPIQKSSFEGDANGKGSIIPADFKTGGDKKQVLQPVTMQLNIDGRALAQATSGILEDLYEHPTGSPSPDGLGHFRPQGNFSST